MQQNRHTNVEALVLKAAAEGLVEQLEASAKADLPKTPAGVIAKLAQTLQDRVEEKRATRNLQQIQFKRLRRHGVEAGETEMVALLDRAEAARSHEDEHTDAMEEAVVFLRRLANEISSTAIRMPDQSRVSG